MNRPRLSIRTLGLVVALAAVDCLLLRIALGGNELVAWFNVIALPIVNILVLAAHRRRVLGRGGGRRPGPTGFEAAGWAGVVGALAVAFAYPRVLVRLVMAFDPIRQSWFDSPAYRAAPPHSSAAVRIWWAAEISLLVAVSATLTAALLLFAACVGWLCSRGGDVGRAHEADRA